VGSLRTAYEAKESDAVIEHYSHVLSTSEYPEGFPKSFALDYIAQTQMLVIEYELPDIEALPKLKAPGRIFPYLKPDDVHFTSETEKKLKDLATQSGRATADELVRDVVEGYILELSQTREMLNNRMTTSKAAR